MSPPCVIFPPRRRPAVIVRLQTADHIRRASTMQEEQSATAAFDRARIMRFTVFNKEYAVSLIFAHNRLGIFSDLLHHKSSYILSEIAPLPARSGFPVRNTYDAPLCDCTISCGTPERLYPPNHCRYTTMRPVDQRNPVARR